MAPYIVGIDLGTTHTVVAYAKASGGLKDEGVRLFEIEQLVAPGEVASRALLPSLRYHPLPSRFRTATWRCPGVRAPMGW